MSASVMLFTNLFDRENPPKLDKETRPGTLSLQAIRGIEAENAPLFAGSRGRVALGLAYLWHDHWEAAHEIAQSDEGERDHDLLHAIVHRRELDLANSGYWFREAGTNAAFKPLSARAANLLLDSPMRDKILPGGTWSPQGFLDSIRKKGPEPLLRALQAEEILAFFETLTT